MDIRDFDASTTITQTDPSPLNVFEPIPGPSRMAEVVWLVIGIWMLLLIIGSLFIGATMIAILLF